MLIAGVVDNQVQDQFHATLMELVLQLVDIANVSIDGIYRFVIANIISLSVFCQSEYVETLNTGC